jgi:sugar lactone lactonase YvrE
MKMVLYLFLAFCLLACSSAGEKEQQDFILDDKLLIPEGVAFDTATQTIYVSSTYKRKIIAIDPSGNVKDFISEAQDDIKSVIGMEVDNRTNSLWAVSSEALDVLPLIDPGPMQWRSSVYQFNLADGRLKNKFILERDSVFLNDITVGPDGTVYITESVQNGLYRIGPGEDSMRLFMDMKPYHFINGICFADNRLFVCSTEGILAVDIPGKQYRLLNSAARVDHGDIDGLSFNGKYFIGHQSTKIMRFEPNAAMDSIVRSDTLNSGKDFDASTTGEIGNNYYYFIVNSQIQSGIDFSKKQVKPLDSLDPIIIRKLRLK